MMGKDVSERTAVVDVATINALAQRVVEGREIQPKRSSLILHDTASEQEDDGGFINQKPPLLTSAAYLTVTRAMEEYVNREKGSWARVSVVQGRAVRGCVDIDDVWGSMDDTLMTRCVVGAIR